jgi:hypothetical protein
MIAPVRIKEESNGKSQRDALAACTSHSVEEVWSQFHLKVRFLDELERDNSFSGA